MYLPKEYIGKNYDSEFIRFLFDIVFINEIKAPNKRVEKNLEKLHETMKPLKEDFKKWREYNKLPKLLTVEEEFGNGYKSELNISEKGISSPLLGLYSKALDSHLIDKLHLRIQNIMKEDITGVPIIVKTQEIEVGDFIPFKLGHKFSKAEYLIDIIYRPNTENILKYIQIYLNLWGNNKLISNENNYLLSDQQISFVEKIIEVAEERYGGKNITIYYGEGKFKENKEIDFFTCFLYLESINQIKIKNHHFTQKKIVFDIAEIKNSPDDIISELGHDTLILYDGSDYDITPGEYNILKYFYKNEYRKKNLLDDNSVSTSVDGLDKIKIRFHKKVSNKVKIKKIRGKSLWYIEKSESGHS